jgi:hypothetical protein
LPNPFLFKRSRANPQCVTCESVQARAGLECARLCDPVRVTASVITDNVKLVLVLAVGGLAAQVEKWQGVRFDHLEDGCVERIGWVFKVGIRELWYDLGRVGQELNAGKLTEGLFVAFGSGVKGHAVIIDVWVTAEADLGVLD